MDSNMFPIRSYSRHLAHKILLTAALTLLSSLSFAMSDPGAIDDVVGDDTIAELDGIINCTDFDAVQSTASFPFPAEERFEHFGNSLLALDKPYHMGHDRIVKAGEAVTVTGEFDYGLAFHKDLEDEKVRAYLTGTGMEGWQDLGTFITNSDGKIFVPVDGQKEGQYKLRMVVLGDLTYADAYISAIEPGKKAVVFDIDETLTTSDLQQVFDYIGLTTADARPAAAQLVNEYIDRGYQPLFITARTYWQAKDTREWLRDAVELPEFVMRTTLSNGQSLHQAAQYKTQVLQEFQAAGLEIVRAYGNADTDAQAFNNVGIPLENTYMIGKNAGINGTQAIYAEGYLQHISDVVLNTPHSGCN